MKSHSITSGLNEKQLTAVTYDAGSILVVAGAGSGKTKVLTTRIAWLIESKNIKPEEILAVTFTNKAAKEMNDRVAHLLEMNTKHMWIGTFHSVALRMLNKNLFEAGLSSKFQILDNNEQIGVIKRMLKNHNFDEKLYPPKDVQRFINNHKEQGIRAKNLTPDTIRAQHMTDLYVSYETFCHKESLLDFTELLLRAYELLQNYPAILEKYRKQFKNILIDEFQDTNNIQYKWLYLLAYKNIDLFAVGDDDQSIYSFRGALVSNMRLLLKDFNIKEPICLEQNYRSTSVILKAANAIIHNNDDRIGKHLWTDKKAGEHIKFYEAYTEEEEANFVCDEIVNLKDEGVSLSDIAILYRSNAQSRNFEQAFYNRSIAYIVYGGLRFFDRQEIKIILAYLKLIVNNNDNDSFIKVVNYPPRGIGVKTIELIEEFATNNSMSLYEASFHMTGTKKSIQSLQQFIKMIDDIKNDIKQLSLSNLINYVIEKIRYEDYIKDDSSRDEYEARIENLKELKNAGEASKIQLAGVPLKKNSETQNISIIGTTGVGKTTAMIELMQQTRDNGQKAVVYDKKGCFVQQFYRPGKDIILNPLDARSPAWNIWADCKDGADFETMAQALIPEHQSNSDPFWTSAARTIFAAVCQQLKKRKLCTMRALLEPIFTDPESAASLSELLKGTIAGVMPKSCVLIN